MNIISWFKNFKGKKEQLLILAAAGILLLIFAMPETKTLTSDKNDVEYEQSSTAETDYVTSMEHRLEEILSKIEGVGNADVMITLASSSEKIIEKDVESRSSNSISDSEESSTNDMSEQSIYSNLTDSEVPYVKQELSPVVEGVLVVADGGDNAIVKQNITEVVQALFGVDTHKIRVMKHN